MFHSKLPQFALQRPILMLPLLSRVVPHLPHLFNLLLHASMFVQQASLLLIPPAK